MSEDVLALLIPHVVILMVMGAVIVYFVLDYRRRRAIVEAYHKERLAAIERGMDIPPLPAALFERTRNRRPRHLLYGMIWLFVGIALVVSLGAVAGEQVMYFGLIPAGIGLAFLLYYFIEGRHEVAEARREGEAEREAVRPGS